MALTKVSGDFIQDGSITQGHLHASHGITTSDIGEGSNLYFTTARVDSRIGDLSTSDLSEGTNLYYTQARFNTAFAAKSTSDLSEGTNLYYTDARVGSYLTTNSYATQSYVNTQVSNLVDSAPSTLDTLNELAAALGDDANFSTTVTNSIATKMPLAGGTFTGQVIFPSAATTKPVLPNGFISRNDLDDTSGRHDIWGISERYYPSNSTAGDAWGIQWSGTPNDIVFVGGGTDRFTVSLDEGNITAGGTITASGGNSTQWNTAYGWGNHASAGYLTSYTETDTLQTVTNRGATTTNAITLSGNSNGLYFTGGNNRIYFSGYRAMEGNTTGTSLQIGEGYSLITIQDLLYVDEDIRSKGQIRATGWYNQPSSSVTGHAVEIGVSPNTSTEGYILSYSRDNSTYGDLNFDAVNYHFNNRSSGTFEVEGSVRTPIFYDSDNTGYYCNPNSTSKFNLLQINNGGTSNQRIEFYDTNTSGYAALRFYFNSSEQSTMHVFGSTWSSSNWPSNSAGAINLSGYNGVTFGAWNSPGGWVYNSGQAQFQDSVRSPIFYDSNDTGYYINPNGQSKIRNNNAQEALIIEGDYPQLTIRRTSVADASIHFDAGFSKKFNVGPGAGGAEEDEFGFAIYSGPRGTHYGTPFRISADTGYVQVGDKDHPAYPLDILGTAYSSADFRAPIFYDSNDTNYYLNPNSTSQISQMAIGTTSWDTASLQLDVAGNASFRSGFYMGISTNNVNSWSGRIYVSGSSQYWNGQAWSFNGTGWGGGNYWTLDNSGNSIAYGSHRAPIFYDSNDTTYYIDPNSTGAISAIKTAGGAQIGTSTSHKLTVAGNGNYMNINYDQIWNAGGNLHLQYSSSGNIDMNHGGGYAFSRTSLRAPVFYDYNNTNFYADPNSISVMYRVKDDHGNEMYSRKHSGSDFANGTLVQTDITSNTTHGPSFVLEATGKSYSSEPPFSFMVQGYLYNNGIINYSGIHFGKPGFSTMKVFDYNGKLAFWWPRVSYWNSFDVHVRDAGGDTHNLVTGISNSAEPSSSKKVSVTMRVSPIHDYNYSTGALYAGLYYDSNDTNYYVNPNSTSRIRKTNLVASGSGWDDGLNLYSSDASNRWNLLVDDGASDMFRIAYNNSEKFRIQTDGEVFTLGTGQAGSDFRAPIFYDSNDTNYFIDPRTATNGFKFYSGAGAFYLRGQTHWDNQPGIDLSGGTSEFRFSSTGGNLNLRTDGWVIAHDYVQSLGQMYATIYYDQNNTAYYTRPASSSNMYSIYTASFIQVGASGYSNLWLGGQSGNYFRFHTNNSDTYFDANVGNIYWRQGSSTRFYFYMTTANMTINGTLTQNSDERIKENIVEIPNALEKIDAMRGVYYNRTDINTEAKKVGLIAQEVETVLPEVVLEAPDTGLKSVAYAELTALLINGIKEQQVIIDDLKARIETLENQ